MKIFTTIEEARAHIEQYRALARSAESRAREAEAHAAATDDPDLKRLWQTDAKGERNIAKAIDKECDDLLRQLPKD